MFFRRVIFYVDNAEVCHFVGMVPPEGREIYIENTVLGQGRIFRVARVREIYGDSDAHDSVMSSVLGGGPFAVIPTRADVYLEPVG